MADPTETYDAGDADPSEIYQGVTFYTLQHQPINKNKQEETQDQRWPGFNTRLFCLQAKAECIPKVFSPKIHEHDELVHPMTRALFYMIRTMPDDGLLLTLVEISSLNMVAIEARGKAETLEQVKDEYEEIFRIVLYGEIDEEIMDRSDLIASCYCRKYGHGIPKAIVKLIAHHVLININA